MKQAYFLFKDLSNKLIINWFIIINKTFDYDIPIKHVACACRKLVLYNSFYFTFTLIKSGYFVIIQCSFHTFS